VEVHFYQPDNLSVSCSALARHQKAQKGFKINVMALEVLDFTRFIQSNTIITTRPTGGLLYPYKGMLPASA
jgi:hypothetical protein